MSWCEQKDDENKEELGGEPTFTLRAQDVSAPALIALWIAMNPKCSPEKIHRAHKTLLDFHMWPKKKQAD